MEYGFNRRGNDVVDAVAISLKNIEGLVCDPVAGLATTETATNIK